MHQLYALRVSFVPLKTPRSDRHSSLNTDDLTLRVLGLNLISTPLPPTAIAKVEAQQPEGAPATHM